jgi:hypothetical protein
MPFEVIGRNRTYWNGLKRRLVGQRFGFLTVLERYSQEWWLCRCEACGREAIVLQQNLVSGNTKSCGCQKFNQEHRQKLSEAAKRRETRLAG